MPAPDRRKELGQYFTPAPVIEFALDALARLDVDGDAESRRIVDPSCGDAGFLVRAVDRGLARPEVVWGTDSDPALHEVWEEHGLLRRRFRLEIADGLLAESEAGFDWVVGNPPYAGDGLIKADAETLWRVAERFELPALRYGKLMSDPEDCRRLPLEVLFVERFVHLCREGGLLAAVLPVGLFANARWRFVREWLLPRVTLELVVQLPRATFGAAGITAHTCLAIARKQPPPPGHEVCFAQVDHIGVGSERNDLPELLAKWQAGESVGQDGAPWRL